MYSLNQMLSALVRSPAAFMISSWKPVGNCGAGSCANGAPLTVIVGAWPAFAYEAIGSDVVLITNSAVAGIVDISVSLWWLPALSMAILPRRTFTSQGPSRVTDPIASPPQG